jgi:hypothetical protein
LGAVSIFSLFALPTSHQQLHTSEEWQQIQRQSHIIKVSVVLEQFVAIVCF